LILVISGDIYSSVVRHGYDGIGQHAFHPLVRVHIAGKRYPGWIHIPEANGAAGDPDSPLQAFQLVRTERPDREVREAGRTSSRGAHIGGYLKPSLATRAAAIGQGL
jgi:hypothetical protein